MSWYILFPCSTVTSRTAMPATRLCLGPRASDRALWSPGRLSSREPRQQEETHSQSKLLKQPVLGPLPVSWDQTSMHDCVWMWNFNETNVSWLPTYLPVQHEVCFLVQRFSCWLRESELEVKFTLVAPIVLFYSSVVACINCSKTFLLNQLWNPQ